MATFQQEVQEESSKLLGGCRTLLSQVRTASIAVGLETTLSDNLEAVAESVATAAATARLNAAYGGSHDDGGASRQMDKLKGYLEGVVTGLSGSVGTNSPYWYSGPEGVCKGKVELVVYDRREVLWDRRR